MLVLAGIATPLGLMSTGKEYRLCWLPASAAVAASEDLDADDLVRSMSALRIPAEEDGTGDGDDEDDVDIKSGDELKREMECSEIFEARDPRLPMILASAVVKMSRCTVKPPSLDNLQELVENRPFVKVFARGSRWC